MHMLGTVAHFSQYFSSLRISHFNCNKFILQKLLRPIASNKIRKMHKMNALLFEKNYLLIMYCRIAVLYINYAKLC